MENHLSDCLGLELEVEFSQLYLNQPLFGDLKKFLNNKDFEFIDFTNLIRWERKVHNLMVNVFLEMARGCVHQNL